MRLLGAALVVLATLSGVWAQHDPLRDAIMTKSVEQIKDILTKASVPFKADDDLETLRALIYEFAQREVPGTPRPWKADGKRPDVPDPKKGAGAKKPPVAQTPDEMSELFFTRMDKDGDGKLTKQEMQPMVDQANAMARQKGVAEVDDLFGQLDVDSDGYVLKAEAKDYFKKMMSGATGAKPAAGNDDANPMDMDAKTVTKRLFEGLDKDGSGTLSRDEMHSVLSQTSAMGHDDDFFTTIDADANGEIDLEEAAEFFALLQQQGKEGGAGKPAQKQEL